MHLTRRASVVFLLLIVTFVTSPLDVAAASKAEALRALELGEHATAARASCSRKGGSFYEGSHADSGFCSK